MFIYPAIKHYKELWRVEDRAHSECLKSVRAEATVKTVWERIHWNPLWKQKIMSRKLNILTQSSRASSDVIYTWECTSTQKDTSLQLFWRRSDRQEQQNVLSSGMLRMGMKTSSSWARKCSPSRSNITTSTTRFTLRSPLRCVVRVQEAVTLPTSWLGGRCPIRGWHIFIFATKRLNWCPSVSRGRATSSCKTS